MRFRFVRLVLAIAVLITLALSVSAIYPKNNQQKSDASKPVSCADLGNNLTGRPGIKSAKSQIVPANGTNVGYCHVNILYGTIADQNVNIRVGLPLNSADGGAGKLEGNWNGRTQGIGGGGCAGNMNVGGPVNAGYVGSGTDTGHTGGDCDAGVNTDGTYNRQFIDDFIRNGIKQQVLLSKSLAKTYYGIRPVYNYWNGCSTGGRQGYLLAQELGTELDGILANAPAIYWTRFGTAIMWGQIVMKNLGVAPISAAKLNQATASAVTACDAADGVTDGLIDDPRKCSFSATANVCGKPTAPAANCLTVAEAQAIDKIWDGPRNSSGEKIWFGFERGTDINAVNGARPFPLAAMQFRWDEHDRNFDWSTVSPDKYAQIAEDGSRNIADVTDTFGDLETFRSHGGKLLTFVGTSDPLIMPRGVINYYRQMASRYGKSGVPDFNRLQAFYRLFRAPGVSHCGGGSGPQPDNLFGALVNWVEKGVAPDHILAQNVAAGAVTRTRPLCPYPQTAIYKGSGDINDAANYSCGGNLEEPRVVCADVLTTYKSERKGPLDYKGTGVNQRICSQ